MSHNQQASHHTSRRTPPRHSASFGLRAAIPAGRNQPNRDIGLPAALRPRWASASLSIALGTGGRLLYIVLLCALLLAACSQPAFAAIIFTEIHPNPNPDQPEWVELYNDSPTDSVDLTGWWLQDQVSRPTTLTSLANLVLPPLTYTRLTWEGSKLNNSGDEVKLFNTIDEEMAAADYASSQVGLSWSLVTDHNGSSSWQLQTPTPESSPLPLPTPIPTPSPSPNPTTLPTPSPSPTSTPVPTPTTPVAGPADLILTSIMACPEDGQPEWIELYNQTNQSLRLDGWQVVDSVNNSRPFSGTIAAQSLMTMPLTSSMLNNTGDTLFLKSTSGQVAATATLPACEEKNVAFVNTSGGWIQNLPTPQTPTTTPTTVVSPKPTITALPDPNPNYFTRATTSELTNSLAPPHTTTPVTPQPLVKPILNVPLATTKLFQQPIQLYQEVRPIRHPGARPLAIGGLLISSSSGFELYRRVRQLSTALT